MKKMIALMMALCMVILTAATAMAAKSKTELVEIVDRNNVVVSESEAEEVEAAKLIEAMDEDAKQLFVENDFDPDAIKFQVIAQKVIRLVDPEKIGSFRIELTGVEDADLAVWLQNEEDEISLVAVGGNGVEVELEEGGLLIVTLIMK